MKGADLAGPLPSAGQQQGTGIGTTTVCYGQRQRRRKLRNGFSEGQGDFAVNGLFAVGLGVGEAAITLQAGVTPIEQFLGLEIAHLAVGINQGAL